MTFYMFRNNRGFWTCADSNRG